MNQFISKFAVTPDDTSMVLARDSERYFEEGAMEHRRKTKEELLEGCAVVLEDPALCRIIVDAHTAKPHGVPTAVKKVADRKGYYGHIASALRRAAVLVREYPETISLFARNVNESEQTMSTTTAVKQRVLKRQNLYSKERISFSWTSVPSELQFLNVPLALNIDLIDDFMKINHGDVDVVTSPAVGFILRISFPLRPVAELVGQLDNLGDREQAAFRIDGVRVHPKLWMCNRTLTRELSSANALQDWYERLRDRESQGIPMDPIQKIEIGYIEVHVFCGAAEIESGQAAQLLDPQFRDALMLGCIRHFLSPMIETEEIEYEPVAEEVTSEPQASPVRVTDEQMETLLDFTSESSSMDLNIEPSALITEMLACTDNLSKPVILDVKIGESGLSGQRVCQQIKGDDGQLLNRLLRLAGSAFYASARVTPEGRLKVTIRGPEDEDESTFVQCKLDERV